MNSPLHQLFEGKQLRNRVCIKKPAPDVYVIQVLTGFEFPIRTPDNETRKALDALLADPNRQAVKWPKDPSDD